MTGSNNDNIIYTVYCITNIINNVIYIGYTKQSIQKRFEGHCHKTSECRALREAIIAYGRDQFCIEAICCTKSLFDALDTERYLIEKYNSMNPNVGYNLNGGGAYPVWSEASKEKLSKSTKGKPHPKQQKIKGELEKNIIKRFLLGQSYEEISIALDICGASITKVVKNHNLPRRKFGLIPSDLKNKIINSYMDGSSYSDIMTDFGISRASLNALVVDLNLSKLRKNGKLPEELKQKVVCSYENNLLIKDIANANNLTFTKVVEIIKNSNIEQRGSSSTQFKVGQKAGRTKISKSVAAQIKEESIKGSSVKELAIKYSVDISTIRKVLSPKYSHRYQFEFNE